MTFFNISRFTGGFKYSGASKMFSKIVSPIHNVFARHARSVCSVIVTTVQKNDGFVFSEKRRFCVFRKTTVLCFQKNDGFVSSEKRRFCVFRKTTVLCFQKKTTVLCFQKNDGFVFSEKRVGGEVPGRVFDRGEPHERREGVPVRQHLHAGCLAGRRLRGHECRSRLLIYRSLLKLNCQGNCHPKPQRCWGPSMAP